jgi:hypothetical protein
LLAGAMPRVTEKLWSELSADELEAAKVRVHLGIAVDYWLTTMWCWASKNLLSSRL